LRLARSAWKLLHVDPARARVQADQALVSAHATADHLAESWARITRGSHHLYFATAELALAELQQAQACCVLAGDRAGEILAVALIARAAWRQGHAEQALALVLPLRDEGLQRLRDDARGMLLNTIAGCYSARGQSEQAFAYLFEALRDAGPQRGSGYDTVLHCNLAHELLEIGDSEQALVQVEQGLVRCMALKNPRLASILRINRVAALTELGRAVEALPDVAALMAVPTDASGRGPMNPHFETLAITALRAGDLRLGAELVARARAEEHTSLPDERLERSIAAGLLALVSGRPVDALATLCPALADTDTGNDSGTSLRLRAKFFALLSDAREAAGDFAGALAALRSWQGLFRAQARLASRARYQAAALQTELLRLQQQLDATDAERRRTERARSELARINEQLSRKVAEVQALQQALRQQATQDPLTGLFNRRHLSDVLPQLFAQAQRDAQPLALVLIDLDHFKSVNDAHGHAFGDSVLAAFGALLADRSRRSDVACRYGGEEFCLLLPRTDAASARRKAQSLLRLWHAQQFDLGGSCISGLCFSAGVADTSWPWATADALLKGADDRLLAAKRAGRNRVDGPDQVALRLMSP
jgi:diguanylate cyclase (GGDEF)-like protein